MFHNCICHSACTMFHSKSVTFPTAHPTLSRMNIHTKIKYMKYLGMDSEFDLFSFTECIWNVYKQWCIREINCVRSNLEKQLLKSTSFSFTHSRLGWGFVFMEPFSFFFLHVWYPIFNSFTNICVCSAIRSQVIC